MKSRVLLAEDDTNFGMMLKIFLEMNQYEVTLCDNGEKAWQAFQLQKFDACIFDVMMPILDGFTLGEKVAQTHSQTPFIYLTAKALKDDQIKGYKIGASDYLIKPFDPEILLLKLQVLLQNKAGQASSTSPTFTLGNYTFDTATRALTIGDKHEKLSPKEAELLQLLCEKQGNILTHEEALVKIWHNDDYFTRQSMNVFITKLRRYLSQDSRISIENLHSKGFVLVVKM
jgi:two-component system OmpR family response regulator